MLPEILLFGQARSGKDTAAEFLVKNHGAVAIAMADPMKRFAQAAFGFSTETLWGPSEARNAIESRFTLTKLNEHAGYDQKYALSPAWIGAVDYINQDKRGMQWLNSVLPASVRDRDKAWFTLRAWAHRLMDIAHEQGGLSARAMLQTLGTEWGRHVDEGMWVKYAQNVSRKLLSGGYTYDKTIGLVEKPGQNYDLCVITDGRFRNECVGFKGGGSSVIRVVNPVSGDKLSAGVKGHASEAEQETIPNSWFDAVLRNDKTLGLKHLSHAVDDLVETLFTTQEF